MMERWSNLVIDHRRAVVALVLLLSVFFASRIVDLRTGVPRLVLDASIDSMLPVHDEGRLFYNRVRRTFGSDETLLLAIHRKSGIFDATTLAGIQRATEAIELIDGVHHVVSLSNAPVMRAQGGDILVEPLFDKVPHDAAALKRLRAEALSDPIFTSGLLSPDGQATAIVVYPMDMSAAEFEARGLDRQIFAAAKKQLTGLDVHMTGGAYVKAETTRYLISDLMLVIPLAFGLMAVIALISFRTVRGVVVPVSTIGIGVIWTMGAAADIDPSLNLVTVAVPSLVLVVGFAYAVHIVNSYNEALPEVDGNGTEAARASLSHVGLATILTGVTTVAGFLSLTISSLNAIRQFGFYCALGVGLTMLATLTWAPALLALMRDPARIPERPAGARNDFVHGVFEALAAFNMRHRRQVLWGGLAVAVISLVGMTRIRVNTNMVSNFPEHSEVRQSFQAVNSWLGGASQLFVVLQADYRDAFKEPRNLKLIENLQARIAERPEVGSTSSLADYVKMLHKGFEDGREDEYTIPDSKRLVSQLLFFGGSPEIERYVDSTYQVAAILVRATAADSRDVNQLVADIDGLLADLPQNLHGRVTGNTVLVAKTSDQIAVGQALSLGTAFLIIYAILVLLFTSFRVGFFALLPNVLPVLVYFGALGWSGTGLNLTTGLVACLVLGIAVDDTIHFLTRFNTDSKRLASEEQGATQALLEVGPPATTTSIALCLGFLVLTVSQLQDQVHFGVLASFTLAVAWAVDMTFTPSMAMGMHIVTLWDVLGLDLGQDPQKALPLLRGLSTTRARIAALMMRIEELPAGSQLIRAGEKGEGMYVVVDGHLRSSVMRGGTRVHLNDHGRGDVIGEVGLFRGERSADVVCETDTRVLRLDRSSLDRLRRRYPRIAAQVHANLSEVLANRLVGATSRIA